MSTTIPPAPIPAAPTITAARAHHAEGMRAQLADFWGKPLRGIPHAMDVLRTMYITVTARDLTRDQAHVYLDLCDCTAAAYRTSDVWVAPDSMGSRITDHPFLTSDTVISGNLEDIAPARNGLVYLPTPIHLDHLHPLYGLAWHMTGSGDDLVVDIETITATTLLPTRLPPQLAATTEDTSNQENGADEDIVNVPRHTSTGTKATARSRMDKRNHRPTRKRPIRIIREPVHTPAATSQDRSADHAPGPNWKEYTLRWEVSEKWQNRCPNPHQHRAIIEAGGECKPVRVRIKEHTNGPKGRPVDPSRTVRIVPDRP
ncbi:hypothetical protein [Streptomyces phaeofaciens]|uniref:hypothetical protein n=1 Tax=Streptomyces phaeofaciens TaxID=68254 RepID=UPI00369D235C